MIVWSSGGDVLDLGAVETRHCETCDTERRFHLTLRYRYCGLFWIFNFVTDRKYMVLCEVCQRGRELDRNKAERVVESVPIPFMQRFGLPVLLVLVAVIVAIVGLGSP